MRAIWPGNTGFFVPTGYGDVTHVNTDLNLFCYVQETHSLAAGFTFAGSHDSTTANLSRFFVNTTLVDQKPLVGGLVKFVASDSAGLYYWDFDGGELLGYDGSPAKPIVKFTSPRKYTVTLNLISLDNHIMSQQDIDLSLEPGDLIFIRTPGWNAPFDLVKECYTHVGMYIGPPHGEGLMIEAAASALAGNPHAGVQTTPLFNRWSHPTECFATAYRVKNATPVQRQQAVAFALARLGQPYDFNIFYKQLNGNSYYCSELIWAAYLYAAGIDLGQTGPQSNYFVHPDHIAKDTAQVTFIGGHWEHYEPQLPKGRAIGATIHLLLRQDGN